MTATATPSVLAILDQSGVSHEALAELRAAAYASEESWREMRKRVTSNVDLGRLSDDKRVKSAYALHLLGHHGVAIEELTEAKADKDAVGAYVLGLCYLARSDFDQALAAFQAGLKKDKGDVALQIAQLDARRARAEYQRAMAGTGDGRDAKAEASAKKALDEVAQELASVLEAARALAKKNPKSADAHYQLGRALEACGEHDDAMDVYEEALAAAPDHAASLYRLACAHELRGSQLVALEYYRRVCESRPTYPNALVNYGLLLEDLAKDVQAGAAYQKVLQAQPDNDRAKMFLKDAEASEDMYYDEDMERRSSRRNAILRIPVTDFELSVRARNCLNKMNIRNLGDLVTKTEEELLAYKNFGETSLHEITQMLAQKGLRLGMYQDGLDGEPTPGEGLDDLEAGEGEAAPTPDNNEILLKPVADLELSVRARNCMERLGVRTIGDLAAKSETELLGVKNFGQTSLNELKQKLAENGLTLKP